MQRRDPRNPLRECDVIDAGLIVVDAGARVELWNDWMATAAGVPEEAARGKRLNEIFPTAVNSRLPSAIAEALSSGVSSILTHSLNATMLPLKTSAGRSLIHNIVVRPMGGEPARCLIQVTDVTMAAERDRILRQRQNARYDSIVESAPDAILTLDTNGVIHLANPAAARELGYETSDLVGRPAAFLFEDQDAWMNAWTAVLAGGSIRPPFELVAHRKDGSPCFLEISASRWRTGSPVFVTAILRDVGERHAAEQILRSLNQTLERRVAESTADRDRMWRLSTEIMLVWRAGGLITATNPAWNKQLGWDEATLIGKNFRDVVVDEDRPKLDAALEEIASTGAPTYFELRVSTFDGGSRSISWSAVAADDVFQAVGRDITARHEAEEALRQAEEALRQSQKMEAIGQLSGGIAHDFNNLLTGIIGSMEMLKRRITAHRYDDVERFMDAAVTSAKSAASLTHRLLAFARRQALDHKPLDVNKLVERMDDLLRRSLGEQIELDVSLAEDLWPTLTDANQLENALLNLAINGRDAMSDRGRLTIKTANITVEEPNSLVHGSIEPGDYALICVGDTGMGMSRETVAKAFDPFFTTKPIGQGTGLGLSMVYGFVKQSSGHVQIESEIGHGTKVKLYLPRYLGVLTDGERSGPVEPPHGSGETVLLVEDDPSVRLLIAEVLRELGYACLEASDGQVALPIIVSHVRLDLMITDVGLPGLNGRQLAEIGRQHRPDLKVLFVSGYAERATIGGGGLGPGTELVTKPFSLEILGLKIREMIAAPGPSRGRVTVQ
jgi:PAS domain S-box-containing protein